MPQTIALVSCVKTKAPEPQKARNLYTSSLFRFSSSYAETITNQWYILSAKYGLVHPDEIIAPYEKTLNKMPAAERKAWAADVLESLKDIVGPGDKIVFLAGVKYRQDLIRQLKNWGCTVSIPLEGLSFGQQLSWLKKQLHKPGSGTPPSRKKIATNKGKTRLSESSGGSMPLADRIREHTINQYISPARESGLSTIKISAKEVHADLGLKSRYPAICNALDGDIFKEKARVILRSRSGPRQSSTVTWTFEIL